MIMWYSSLSFDILFIVSSIILVSKTRLTGCNPIANSNFNEHVREFSLKEDEINATNARTLHKDGIGRDTNFGPRHNPIRFKEESDSALASSGQSRGFTYPEYAGHHDYEEVPYYGYGHEYHVPDYDTIHHHHPPGYHGHDHQLDHHHRHYNHALAAKAVLWPIAGLALLGAAAALVTNPILLQLGVATGKRRRRDTEETNADLDLPWAEDKIKKDQDCLLSNRKLKRKLNNADTLQKRKHHHVFKKAMNIEDIDKKYVQIATKSNHR